MFVGAALYACSEARAEGVAYVNVPDSPVLVVSTDNGTVIGSIAKSDARHVGMIAASPDGRYAYIYENDAIEIVDVSSRTVTGQVPHGNSLMSPTGMVVGPDSRLYVDDMVNKSVDIFDAVNGSPLGKIQVGSTTGDPLKYVGDIPTSIGISPDGRVLYVANMYSGGNLSSANVSEAWGHYNVKAYDARTGEVRSTVYLGMLPDQLLVSPDGSTVYVSAMNKTMGIFVVPIATGDMAMRTPMAMPVYLTTMALTPDGRQLFAGSMLGNTVAAIDVSTGKTLGQVTMPSSPLSISVTPDSKKALVCCSKKGLISIDTASYGLTTLNASIDAFTVAIPGPAGQATAASPTAAPISAAIAPISILLALLIAGRKISKR